ncbi:MAG: ribonuclease E activity regulator RraA [Gammaproteobacteria bacterium]|nr:ribonuclease E activity regulator RraA [Gammaproteobacteria bacterium]NNC97951.1 ribonuclease E activity regulator RraA [Gammaproteobacteria bacterium]NNM13786.1 ribonuclease E activity regulator RraA [Gammaproteobacteria bacterium]
MSIPTADLCDQFIDELQVAESYLIGFGGKEMFGGEIYTVKVFDDNVLVKQTLASPGKGRVLVVDGAASNYCALMGDNLATLAMQNDWAGVVINGCIRDARQIGEMDVGVYALGTCPRKSRKAGEGDVQIPVAFAGILFKPGHFLYADEDGIVVAERDLS